MKFIIDRKTWLRGEDFQHSYLLRAVDQKMCCIGQMCLQLGVDRERLSDVAGVSTLLLDIKPPTLPSDLTAIEPVFLTGCTDHSSKWTEQRWSSAHTASTTLSISKPKTNARPS